MDLREQNKILQAAAKYADSAGGHLKSVLGKAPDMQELVVFASGLSAIFGSWVYQQMFAAANQAAADTFLNQIFAQMAASIQSRGVPVVLNITAKSFPIKQKESVAVDTEGARCKCITEADGSCPGCNEHIRATIAKISGFAEQSALLRTKGSCEVCFRSMVDAIFADIIHTPKFKALDPQVRDVVITMVMQSAQYMKVGSMPLSEKALAELES